MDDSAFSDMDDMDTKQDAPPVTEEKGIEEGKEKPLFEIYTKSGCPYCDKAEDLLNSHYGGLTRTNVGSFTVFSQNNKVIWKELLCDEFLKTPADKAGFLTVMEQSCGRPYKTFPMVFKRDEEGDRYVFLGGYTDLLNYVNRELLKNMA